MTGRLDDLIELGKIAAGAIVGGGGLKLLQLRAANRLTDAQADVQSATAEATEAHATAELIHAATQTVAATGPLLSAEIARQAGHVDRLDAQLVELRAEVVRLMGRSTEDRVEILTLTARTQALTDQLAAERARNTRTDAYLGLLRAWAGTAVREIARLGGTIADPPEPPLDPPAAFGPPVPAPRPPSE